MPDSYYSISRLANEYGVEAAAEVANFESANVEAVSEFIREEKVDCDFVVTRAIDVQFSEEHQDRVKAGYDRLVAAGVEATKKTYCAPAEHAETISGVKGAKGCFSYTACHLWPYKLIHHMFSKAIAQGVNMQTNTPVQEISSAPDTDGFWILKTGRGNVRARKVIVAANAYTAALLPEYSERIIPYRAICSHIVTPGKAPFLNNTYALRFADWDFDYLIPRPDGSIIVGGARRAYIRHLEDWYGNVDDTKLIDGARNYFDGYMQRHFSGWENSEAYVDDIWTGIMGYSSDRLPRVGPIPGRPGMFIMGGFSGHGMPQVFLCAQGLADMILGAQSYKDTGLPRLFEESKARLEDKDRIGPVQDFHDPEQEFSLPPVDGGKQAWCFLAACFCVDALIWGFPLTFGVFQNYYSTHAPLAGSTNIAVIGTCATGAMYFSAPIIILIFRVIPRCARWAPITGLIIACLALATSSFATTVPRLIITQGLLYGIGGSIAYIPCILYADEWFVRRKGLAYGIMWSGTSLAGIVLPLLMEALLSHFGHQITLRIWTGVLFALCAPVSYFIRPRIPPTSAHSSSYAFQNPLSNFRFLLSGPFALFQLANVVEALGYFLPSIYLPSYAQSFLGAASFPAAATLLCCNVASAMGSIAMGWFVDHLHVSSCLMLSSVGATISSIVLWGLSSNMPVLYLFCIVYGLFAGAYSSAWPGIMINTVDRERAKGRGVDPMLVFGCLCSGRGVGNMLSGPLSEALFKSQLWNGEVGFGYGSGYGILIVFTGVTALLGGSTYVWKRIGWLV
ncbi:hypothetical protein G7Z17_g819 [Cylindrodendrum hubeiense]|uniref:Major facilitator superfamily (MFS) profile domain-containing protein n=1 Tax=Cylindrodendrum hubeiense TaxID=595255 RepID=A0A9P5HKU5_9HYPO|nr:hypothetical protein G7Z17_g819 [Cylindrodendrum hubeiense]